MARRVAAGFHAAAELRKVSLRGLEEAIEASLKAGKALPDEAVLLAACTAFVM